MLDLLLIAGKYGGVADAGPMESPELWVGSLDIMGGVSCWRRRKGGRRWLKRAWCGRILCRSWVRWVRARNWVLLI